MHLVDPRKTIKAPYSQGDVVVFGQNPGQQCVAMSLCALIYHNMKGIGNPNDLKQIMHIGNQLLVKQFVTIIKTIIFTANRITINAYSTRGRLSARIQYNITGKFV